MTINHENLKHVIGEELVEFEVLEGNHETNSGAEQELVLSFSNGKEIIVYVAEDGNVWVEGD